MDNQQPNPPLDFDSLSALIHAKHVAFPRRLAQVSRYLIDNPDEVALGSVASIADAAQVTPSTVMRFAQLLGYDGFSALQEIFRQSIRAKLSLHGEVTNRKSVGKGGLSAGDTLGETIDACCKALSGLSRMVTAAEIDGAVAILLRARCVFIQGTRSTFPMTVALQQALIGKSIRSTLSMDVTGGHDVFALATSDDAAIFISRSADDESVFHVSALAAKGVPIIAIADSGINPYKDLASISFELGRTGATTFLMPTLAIALTEVLVNRIEQSRRCLSL
ncbi:MULTISPECIES: MurR/RpiR family transcriptional regulator [Agrobacterium]|uniref:MurR/RpiR family transcriptional regulator n=1 Tax=Agrobacterium TaxID=357 RepID=UPI0009BB63B1|nr:MULTISPECIES: MurR/RpiR family transcriptional regulator [Agrobacterium]POO52722.1 MurR/RpiR family transcriptional regulator [Agrobacterium rosae]CUX06671.1 putative Transcriptional regulator, RpiR family [Agrobacterium fabacearum S56]